VRIGLHTGKVLAGIVGAESRLDFTAVGTPAAMAEWVAESAAPGEVLITGKTLAAVGTRFEVSPRGEQVVRSPDVRTAVFEVREEDVARPSMPGSR
jgi:class 3 adenylate cyclase